jgi:hypothetical protein
MAREGFETQVTISHFIGIKNCPRLTVAEFYREIRKCTAEPSGGSIDCSDRQSQYVISLLLIWTLRRYASQASHDSGFRCIRTRCPSISVYLAQTAFLREDG